MQGDMSEVAVYPKAIPSVVISEIYAKGSSSFEALALRQRYRYHDTSR